VLEKPISDTYILLYIVCSRGEEFSWGPYSSRVTYSRIGGCRSITPGRPNGKKKIEKKLNYKGMIPQCNVVGGKRGRGIRWYKRRPGYQRTGTRVWPTNDSSLDDRRRRRRVNNKRTDAED